MNTSIKLDAHVEMFNVVFCTMQVAAEKAIAQTFKSHGTLRSAYIALEIMCDVHLFDYSAVELAINEDGSHYVQLVAA